MISVPIQAALQRNPTPVGSLRETDRAEVYASERWMREKKVLQRTRSDYIAFCFWWFPKNSTKP